ncbi:ABC-2 type transport system permease protein [Saccharopolyspora antimicrobica]|uniref:ABC-2 type transport system permease protein n=1 Tax=Saccharopolyspora antimicrobica TaxID=455193 RepID=A0A1I4WYZ2_9PSEU|nr:ABC transporter permease [Saccharopolyspora antimicrobica]RKT84205.1 ABC-2 type transport system permease protein [Saccharopolyspora antimicrobica]SFN18443.1 ABC-2 type transport system permease protein [Saccharopolyspora antimicrobica]
MQSTSTVDRPEAPPATSSQTWRKAFKDISDAYSQRQLWAHLGWQDIKQRYRRSVIGPLWITISMAVTVTALGLLYSQLFGMKLEDHLPYLAVGFIIWGFISNCVNEGSEVFISNEGLIKQLPAPVSIHVLRLLWRQVLFFVHNLAVYFVLLMLFPKPLSFTALLAIPAFALIAINGAWVIIVVGTISTRFRDIPPVTQSVVQLMFFMTPIVWNYDQFRAHENPAIAERARLAELNPFMHFLEIVRQPMLGSPIVWHHWLIVGVFTVVGWAVALVVLRNYRARISYWV